MSSSAFDTIARSWGDAVAERVRSHLAKQEPDLPIRVRHAADFINVSRQSLLDIFRALEVEGLLRSEELPLCVDCDEPLEDAGGGSSECDLCGRVVKAGKTETYFFTRNPLLYAVPQASAPPSLAEPLRGAEFEHTTWDAIAGRLPVDALLMTAVPVELRAIRSLLEPPDGGSRVLCVPHKESTYYVGRLGTSLCAVVMSDAGSVGRAGAILTLHDAVSRLRPAFVLAIGIAFGKDASKQAIGDVLISTQVIPYENERVQASGDVSRAPKPEAGMVLLNRLRMLETEDAVSAKMRFGPLLSGEKLVDDPDFKALLLDKHPTAIGGEMEAAGIYAAAERNRIEWVVVKAICDWGDGTKNDEHQKNAASNAAQVVATLLTRGGLGRSEFAHHGSVPTAPPSAELPEVEVTANPFFRSPRPGRGRRRK